MGDKNFSSMDLVEYLLTHGVKHRETALYMIKNKMVYVNGSPVTYPSIPVQPEDKVTLIHEEYKTVPPLFWKIREIQEEIELIQRGDFVLDVESPDGGFPLFACKVGGNVTLVTIRSMDWLKKEGVEIIKRNIVLEDPKEFLSTKFDVIMIETKLDVIKNIQILEKLRNLLDSRGKLIMFLPTRGRENVKDVAEEMLLNQGLETIDFFSAKNGVYVYAKNL